MTEHKPAPYLASVGGWSQLLDLRFVSVTEDEIIAESSISAKHHQPMGIVHGGVYCSIVETVCSLGAALRASKHGLSVLGLENQTSFLKATRSGVLQAVGKPIVAGRRTQLWEANIYSEDRTLVATGRLRLLCTGDSAGLGKSGA